MNAKKYEKGQALIMIVFAIIGLIGLTGLTVDGGRAYSDRRNAQNAADTAAIAAALAKTRGQNVQGFTTAALQRAASNGYDDNGVSNEVTVTTAATPLGACPDTGLYITVTIVSTIPTTFTRVLGRTDMTNRVSSVVRTCDVSGGIPLYAGNSVFATKQAACGSGLTHKSLYMNGNADLKVWGGGFGSASTDGNCVNLKAKDALFGQNDAGECADISTSANGGGDFSALVGQDGCGNINYNQSFDPPPDNLGITCSTPATWSGGTMNPGYYTGTFPPSNVTTLNPGTYCVNGPFTVNANTELQGNGVTIVMNSGDLQWNGSATINLSAPTDSNNPYKGLLIYYPPSNSSDLDVNGNSGSKITGTILAQNSDCYFAGTGDLQRQTLQFICYTWGMDGDGTAELEYNSSLFFTPVIDPTVSTWK